MDDYKFVCHKCISESYIKKLIKEIGSVENSCTYCHKTRKNKTISIDALCEKVDEMLDLYYEITERDTMFDFSGSNLSEIVQNELGVDEDIATDIFDSLKDQFNDYHDVDIKYDDDYRYLPNKYQRDTFGKKWNEITRSLQSEARFFNRAVKEFLDELFSDITTHVTRTRSPVIRIYDTETILYRARVFNTEEEVKDALSQPESSLGAPPSQNAKSGRMNAHGVPVFYGSTSPDIAMAEVRPAVGSRVVMAVFYPIRELRILDLSALKSLINSKGSKFDPINSLKEQKIQFLRTLSYKLTVPVLGEVKGHEYLITQAVSEYLGLSPIFNLDGISFDSTQVDINQVGKDQRNVVLFSKSSTVKYATRHDIKREYEVTLYEYEEFDGELQRNPNPSICLKVNNRNNFPSSRKSESDSNGVLRLDVGALQIHRITGVTYSKDTLNLLKGSDINYPTRFNHNDFDLSDLE